MADELSADEYKVRLKDSRIVLQSKEEIKETLGRSPNNPDELALTFAFPVMKTQGSLPGQVRVVTDYGPYSP